MQKGPSGFFQNNWRLRPTEIFNSENIWKGIGGKSIRGGVSTMTAQGIVFFLNMGRTVVLARLLTPQDFGVIAMVTVIIGFAEMFKDAGLSMATVQKKEITKEQISTLFWINLLISIILGLVIAGSAPLIASFYGRQELIAVTLALAFPFIIRGIIIQHQALLNRHMRFGILALEKVLSTIVGLIVAIVLASMGMKYWALIGSFIAIAITNLLVTFYFCPWLPGKPSRRTGARQMLIFGGHLTAFNIVNYFSRNADNILIGKFIGAYELGLYNKAYQLFLFPLSQIRNPIKRVAMPALSSLQNQHVRYLKYYLIVIDFIATVSIPISVYLVLEAKFIILTILGEQWIESIPVFRTLAIVGIISPVVGTRGLVLMSLGYSKRFFYLGLILAIGNITSFILGLPFGIIGVATAYVIAQYIMILPSLFYSFYKTPVQVSRFLNSILLPILITMASGISILLINYFFDTGQLLIHVINIMVFFGVYISITWLRKSIREIFRTLTREILKKNDNKGTNNQ